MTVFAFRPLQPGDLPTLHDWLTRPHVAEWWRPTPTLAELEEEFAEHFAGSSGVKPYIALVDGSPVGYIQSYTAMGSGGGWWTDARAIRAYEKAGFRALREVDTPDGRALLMIRERPAS